MVRDLEFVVQSARQCDLPHVCLYLMVAFENVGLPSALTLSVPL